MRNPILHPCINHIEVHYHYVIEILSIREINLAYVPTQDNIGDIFRKACLMRSLKLFAKL